MSDPLSQALAVHKAVYLADVNEPETVARIARVPLGAILAAIGAGELPARYIPGHGWRISKRAVLAWIEGCPPGEDRDGRR